MDIFFYITLLIKLQVYTHTLMLLTLVLLLEYNFGNYKLSGVEYYMIYFTLQNK